MYSEVCCGMNFVLDVCVCIQVLCVCCVHGGVMWSAGDDRRVKLKEIPGEKGSDYINASFIDVSLCLLY